MTLVDGVDGRREKREERNFLDSVISAYLPKGLELGIEENVKT